MDRYYEQLIEDIREAATRRPEHTVYAVVVHDSWIDKYPGYDFWEGKTFSEWFGLEKEIFPPYNKFTREQQAFLADILANLYYHYNNELGVSKYEDATIRYILAVEALESEGSYVEDCKEVIYFCNRDQNDCPFDVDCFCSRTLKENPASF